VVLSCPAAECVPTPDPWNNLPVLVEVVVGVIGRAHGVRGEVAVEPRTDEPELRFADGAVLAVEGSTARFTVAGIRWQAAAGTNGRRLLVSFAELDDRNDAEAVRGTILVTQVDQAERPADPEEFYDRQLVGLRVVDAHGVDRGEVAEVLHLPFQDLLQVRTPTGIRSVPFVATIVPDVDLDNGRVVLADLPGLLDDLPDEPAEVPAEVPAESDAS